MRTQDQLTSVNLVISASYAAVPSLTATIRHFSSEGTLTWLCQDFTEQFGTAAKAPVISSIADTPDNGQLTILVAPDEEVQLIGASGKALIRVVERKSRSRFTAISTILVGDFSQLIALHSVTNYCGLLRLLNRRKWTSSDFRNAVLDRYADSRNQLRFTQRAVVFGAQRLGELVRRSLSSSGIAIEAFVDNNPLKHGTCIDGIPVHPLSQIADRSIPVIVATTRFTNSIKCQLEREGFHYFLPYSVLSLVDSVLYPHEIPYIDIQEDFAENACRYLELFLTLGDDKSRLVLDGLINYRLDYDTRFAVAVADVNSRQYFDCDLFKFSCNDVFVDLGGYDGDTTEKFIEYSGGSYRKIYVFEPDENLLRAAAERLRGAQSIEYVRAGAYSEDGELRFSVSGRTNGAISESGTLVVPVSRLDTVMTEPPTLIKIDIEGSETHALHGAANLLRTAKPKLAIAAYHFASDLWKLVDVVREINPTYKFYLRHYSESGLESVIYAI